MAQVTCTVVVERVGPNRYRATCHLFPDCETFATTEENARRSLESVMERIIRERSTDSPANECHCHESH